MRDDRLTGTTVATGEKDVDVEQIAKSPRMVGSRQLLVTTGVEVVTVTAGAVDCAQGDGQGLSERAEWGLRLQRVEANAPLPSRTLSWSRRSSRTLPSLAGPRTRSTFGEAKRGRGLGGEPDGGAGARRSRARKGGDLLRGAARPCKGQAARSGAVTEGASCPQSRARASLRRVRPPHCRTNRGHVSHREPREYASSLAPLSPSALPPLLTRAVPQLAPLALRTCSLSSSPSMRWPAQARPCHQSRARTTRRPLVIPHSGVGTTWLDLPLRATAASPGLGGKQAHDRRELHLPGLRGCRRPQSAREPVEKARAASLVLRLYQCGTESWRRSLFGGEQCTGTMRVNAVRARRGGQGARTRGAFADSACGRRCLTPGWSSPRFSSGWQASRSQRGVRASAAGTRAGSG